MPLSSFAVRFVSGIIQSEKQKQEEIFTKRFITKNWLGKCKICKTGCQEEEAGTHRPTMLSQGRISSLREASALLLRPFNRLNQAHPDYLG